MFLDNKYTKWYHSIIQNAKLRTTDEYTEKHHIIPKSLKGDNSENNLVKLTAREHFICHMLLVRMTENKEKIKMSYALWRLCNSKKYNINSRIYQTLRENHSKFLSEQKTGVKRKPFTEQARKNMSEAHKGLKMNFSPEGVLARRLGSLKLIGKPTWNKGKKNPYAEETLKKMSESFSRRMKGVPKKKSPCKHCGNLFAPNMINRFHNDNCKLAPSNIT
jgi:hypothetical protein